MSYVVCYMIDYIYIYDRLYIWYIILYMVDYLYIYIVLYIQLGIYILGIYILHKICIMHIIQYYYTYYTIR